MGWFGFRRFVAMGCSLLVMATLLFACGEDSLKLSLPEGANVEHQGSIRIVAEIREQGNLPDDGETVNFNTTVGSFERYPDVSSALQHTEAETAGGRATAVLYSFPGEGGVGTVSASYVTINGITVSDEVTVSVSGGSKVSGKYFSAACDPPNVTAFTDTAERDAMRIRCVVSAKDIFGEPVPKASVKALVESGCSITQVEQDEKLAFVFSLSPDCNPVDVVPLTGEPEYVELGGTHNPRDGLLTVVFYTDGEEGFNDIDRDGQFDHGVENFAGYDLPEPYVDENDSGSYDPGEPFVEVGTEADGWNEADGRWSADTKVWTVARVLFSGKPHQSARTTRFSPTGPTIENGGEQMLSLYLVDINNNPLAAHSDSDVVSFTVEGADIVGPNELVLERTMGVRFTDTGGIYTESFTQNRTYRVTLADEDSDPDSSRTDVTLRTSVSWTPAPYFEDYSPTPMYFDLDVVTGWSD